jgi:hypothetical protein
VIFDLHPTPPNTAGHAGQSFDPRPDAEDLVQDAEPTPALMTVPVALDGPVRTQQLPRSSSGRRTVRVGTTPRRVLSADPRRARTLILPQSNTITLGSSQSEATGTYAAVWPAWLPLELFDADELWIAAPAGDTDVTVITENWAG